MSHLRVLDLKGLRINVKETKIIISTENAGKVTEEDKFSCGVYRKGAGINSTLCQFFSGVQCIKDIVVSKLNWKKIVSLEVWQEVISEHRSQWLIPRNCGKVLLTW